MVDIALEGDYEVPISFSRRRMSDAASSSSSDSDFMDVSEMKPAIPDVSLRRAKSAEASNPQNISSKVRNRPHLWKAKPKTHEDKRIEFERIMFHKFSLGVETNSVQKF